MRVRFETVFRQVARAHEKRPALAPAPKGKGRESRCLQQRIRAREVMGERIAFGVCLAIAVSSVGFAAHAIGTRSGPASMPNPLPALANGVPVNRAIFEARQRDADPDTTGSLPKTAETASETRVAPGADHVGAKPRDTRYVVRWALHGTALVEGPGGLHEVRPGALLPGAGRIMSIEQSDAGWVVVTSETVIGPASL